MSDISVLSDATLQQLANGQTPDPSKLSDAELSYLAENPPNLGPQTSALGAFSRAAVNNFPLGPQIRAGIEDGDYSKNLKEDADNAALAKSEHPVAYRAGAVTGSIAPLAIPGVGEALEAAPIAANAALGAAGAVGNTDLTKDPSKALKDAAIGAGVGGTVGKLSEFLPSAASSLEKQSTKNALQAMNLPPALLSNLDEEEALQWGQFAKDHDLVHGSAYERLDRAHEANKMYGEVIEESGANATPLGHPVDISNLEYEKNSADFLEDSVSRRTARVYRDGIKNIEKLGDNPTFDQLQALKIKYGNDAFNANHEVVSQPAADIYGTLRDAVKETVKSAPEEYQQALNGYKVSNDMSHSLKRLVGNVAAKGDEAAGIGFMGKMVARLPGQSNPAINTATAATIGALGHPFGAAMALTPTINNPAVMSGLQEKAASALTGPLAKMGTLTTTDAVTSHLMNLLQTNPKSLGKYARPLLQASQSGGSQGLAATHFLLANQYPEYNDLIMGRKDDEEK